MDFKVDIFKRLEVPCIGLVQARDADDWLHAAKSYLDREQAQAQRFDH
jgi:hypothetical protein